MYARRFGWNPLRAVVDGRFKYIDAPRPELYNLDADPFEEHDLSSERPAMALAMRRHLEDFGEAAQGTNEADRTVSPEVRARLASLGYVSGALDPIDSEGRDPKDYIGLYNALRQQRVR